MPVCLQVRMAKRGKNRGSKRGRKMEKKIYKSSSAHMAVRASGTTLHACDLQVRARDLEMLKIKFSEVFSATHKG